MLTEAGDDLRPVLRALGEWAARWAFSDPTQDELDPDLLVRWISRHVDAGAFPPRRVVLRFTFPHPAHNQRELRPRVYWLVLDHEEASVCRHDPGFGTDVYVTADLAALYDVYFGRLPLRAATAQGLIELTGSRDLVRAFPRWFTWSSFAPTVRSAHSAHSTDVGRSPDGPAPAGHPTAAPNDSLTPAGTR